MNREELRAAGFSDAEIDAYLGQSTTETSKAPAAPRRLAVASVPKVQAEATGAPRGMSRAEQAQEAGKREERQERFRAQMAMVPAAIANISRDIPGAEAAQAAVRAGVRGQSYREALRDIRSATQALPAAVSIPTRVAGSTLAALAVPGGAATQGAVIGGLSGLTEASPDVRTEERVLRSIAQAAGAGVAGKTLDVGGTVMRAFRTPTRATQMIATRRARDVASDPMYQAFRDMGELPRTEALDEILSLPIVRRAVRTVKSESPALSKLADTDAKVLDAVYKRIGSKAFAAKHGFEAGEARATLLSAIDDASGGAYAPAVSTYRGGSELMGATQRGARALQRSMSPSGGTTAKAALEEGPEALAEWAKTATPEQRRAALRGALGDLRQHGISDLLTPFGLRQGTISFVPGVRRAINASEIANMLSPNPIRRALYLAGTTGFTPRESGLPMER